LRIARQEPSDLDALRLAAVGKALADKLPKLKVWSENGAKSVLIFEVEDILANHGKALHGLRHHLPLNGYIPDYVFFVYAISVPWILQTLVAECTLWNEEAILRWPTYREFDPSVLIDVTS